MCVHLLVQINNEKQKMRGMYIKIKVDMFNKLNTWLEHSCYAYSFHVILKKSCVFYGR